MSALSTRGIRLLNEKRHLMYLAVTQHMINKWLAISSSVFVVQGALQITFSLVLDPLPLPLVQEVVPVSSFPIAVGLFIIWLVALAAFLRGITLHLKRKDF